MATNSIKLLTGNSHPGLARLVAERFVFGPHSSHWWQETGKVIVLTEPLPSRLGVELTKILVLQYSNQETSITIGESVRDEDGIIILP